MKNIKNLAGSLHGYNFEGYLNDLMKTSYDMEILKSYDSKNVNIYLR